MKINFEHWNGRRTLKISEYMRVKLSDSGAGQIEQMEGGLENTSQALGRLCEVMADKDLLSADEITYIAEGFINAGTEFVTETETD